MVKIILCCSAGMSTSLFVSKIRTHAEEIDVDIDIIAIPVAELDANLKDDVDLVMLAPQIRFQLDAVKEKTNKPVMVIDMRDYGMMNVQKVLPEILKTVNE